MDVLVEAIDLASPGAASHLKSSLDARSVAIDILLNNAGYGLHGDFLEAPIEPTVNMIQLNITAGRMVRKVLQGTNPAEYEPKSSQFSTDSKS